MKSILSFNRKKPKLSSFLMWLLAGLITIGYDWTDNKVLLEIA